MMRYVKKLWRILLITVGLTGFWQLFILLTHTPWYILPGPLLVAKTFIRQFPLLITQSWPTLIETLSGLAGALALGSITAVGMAYLQALRHWLKPLLLISQALPTFAIAPLFVLWFGFGMSSKIATTMLMLFFPITSAFFDGLRRTEPAWLDIAQMAGASRWRTLWIIRIPAALPALVSGMRVATAVAPIGAVIGEWVGAGKGLGFLMLDANARAQVDLMFAALLMLVFWSLILYFLVDFLLRRYVDWQPET